MGANRAVSPLRIARGVLVAVGISALLMLSGCSAEKMAVPNVVGYRLDDAHRKLQGSGFEKFDDVDVIANRTPFMDSNWVVLRQTPGAGDAHPAKTTIKLEIGKPEDDGVRAQLPVGSPVYEELKKKDAQRKTDEANEARRRSAEAKKAKTEFVDSIDPRARSFKNAMAAIINIRDEAVASGAVSVEDSILLINFKSALGNYWQLYEGAPDSLNRYADSLQEAVRMFQRAVDTLQSAEGTAGDGAVTRFNQLYTGARTKYNAALTSIYAASGVPTPTL